MLAPNTLSAPKLHDVTVITRKTYSCARVEGVPPEEFGISRHAKSIKDCGYCFHEVLKTQSQLIEDGFDETQIKGLPSYNSTETDESRSRDTVDESGTGQGDEGLNQANRLIKITEHYVRMDYEGNGKAKLYRVTTGGDQGDVLRRDDQDDIVEVDMIPFAAMTPVIITHRFFGRSVADLVMDIQRIKTALMRGMLDNLYLHNNPRVVVSESASNENTLDDLLISRPGGIVRAKTTDAVEWQLVPDITGSVYPALQYADATREWRTGVSRQGQGVDPNALQNQVATIANQMFNASQAKVKLIARIFAETGIRDLFSLLHATIRKNGQQAETVRLRNQWVEVNPRDWKERNDMTISVGLGTGSKEQQLAGAQLLIGAQEKAVAVGMVSKQNLFNSAKQLVRLLGHKDPEEFFTNPGAQPDPENPAAAPIEPPPNPDLEKAKIEFQFKEREAQNKAAIEQTQAEADIATQRDKIQAELVRDDRKMQFDMTLEQQRFELERELKLIDAQLKRESHQFDMQAKQAMHEADLRRSEDKHVQTIAHTEEKAEIQAEHMKAKDKE